MISFSSTAGTSGITTITVTATENHDLASKIANYTLSNTSGNSVLLAVAQQPNEPEETYIEFSPLSFDFDPKGGTGAITVNSNDNWHLVSNGWIKMGTYGDKGPFVEDKPNHLDGSGNQIIGITIGDNTGITRTGGITGRCISDSGISAVTIVSQSGSYEKPYIIVTPNKMNIPSTGAYGCSATVQSNMDKWQAAVGYLGDWITLHTTSGSGDGTVVFDVAENRDGLDRNDIVEVFSEQIKDACSVIQSSASTEEPYLIVSPLSASVKTSGGSFTLIVSSNTRWDSVIDYGTEKKPEQWISMSYTSGDGDALILVTVDSMLMAVSDSSREADIIISDSYGHKYSVHVVQANQISHE